MACGVPCVVTDVGDSAQIVGETGLVVPPRNPSALANAWQCLLTQGHHQLHAVGQLARQRVVQHFSISAVVRSYEDNYERVVAMRTGGAERIPRSRPCLTKHKTQFVPFRMVRRLRSSQ